MRRAMKITAEILSSSQQVGAHVLGDIDSTELPVPQPLPDTGKALAEGTAHVKAGLALVEDGEFPEQMKYSKTLSCQFEEAYTFCKLLGYGKVSSNWNRL